MSDVVRVQVGTEEEIYPALGIWEVGNPEPGDGFDIPIHLWRELCHAQEIVERAEVAIMEHIAARYPQTRAVHEWLGDLASAPVSERAGPERNEP
jgi:hypothetical protein